MHASTTHSHTITHYTQMSAALQEAPPEAEAEAAPRVTFASTLEVGLYVRWRRALDGDDALMTGASAAEEAARDRWWHEIVREYTSTVRRYHGLTHLQQMFGEMDRHVGRLARPDLVALAIFFHDLIYDPRSSTNEEDSAERFRLFAEEATRLPGKDIEKVHAYILATKTHKPALPPSLATDNEKDEDLLLFLDFDMSILGQPRQVYMMYAGAIRSEYKHVPRSTYLTKRTEVLSSILGEGRREGRREGGIYASNFYWQELEEQARENIAGEIIMLRSGEIPYEEKEEEG